MWLSLVKSEGGKLDAAERISEIIFGLIMVLTFTCTMSAANSGRQEVQTVLWAALGCNVAWGIIDAFFYIFSVMMYRGESLNTLDQIRRAQSDEEAKEAISAALPPLMSNLVTDEQYHYFADEIRKLPEPPKKTLITWKDGGGAIKVFLLVFLSTFPVAVPFIFIPDVLIALRVSNGVALLLLFIAGFTFGKRTRYSPIISGLMIMGIGALLVAMTIALGG